MGEEVRKAPNIRFKGYTDDWEQRKLGEITNSYSGGTPSVGNKLFYGGSIPFIRSGEINSDKTELFITKEGLNSSSAKMVELGDILYALYGATSGEVSISRISGAINQAILAIKPLDAYNSNFIMQWLRKEKENIISTYLQGGQGNLSGNIVKELIIELPNNKTEQEQIGLFFKNFDNLITLHQRKLDLLKVTKKSMLQKMFPKDGESVPEIRFAGFTDEWEQRELGELVTQVIREVNKPNEPYWRLSVRSHAKGTFHQFVDEPEKVKMDKLYVIHENDLVVNITFAWEHAIAVASKEDTGLLVSHRFPMYRTDGKCEIKFLKYIVSQEHFRRKMDLISPGGAGRNRVLSKTEFLKIQLIVPSSIEEQKKIGQCFQNMDNLITLHQRELDLLKDLKKSMLQQMFI